MNIDMIANYAANEKIPNSPVPIFLRTQGKFLPQIVDGSEIHSRPDATRDGNHTNQINTTNRTPKDTDNGTVDGLLSSADQNRVVINLQQKISPVTQKSIMNISQLVIRSRTKLPTREASKMSKNS